MAKNYYDITLAMAGISRAARLVQQLAHEGQCNREAFQTSLKSLLQMDPPSTLAVFGGEERNLMVGLETLMGVLNANNKGPGAELTRYTISLMVLERKLNANKPAMNTLGERLGQLERQLAHFDLESDTIISALAGIYVDVVSPLGPRIRDRLAGNLAETRRCRPRFAPRCWPAFAPPCCGNRSAAAACS